MSTSWLCSFSSGGSASAPTAKSSARTIHPRNPPIRIAALPSVSGRDARGRTRTSGPRRPAPSPVPILWRAAPLSSPRLDIHPDDVVAQDGGVEHDPLFVAHIVLQEPREV